MLLVADSASFRTPNGKLIVASRRQKVHDFLRVGSVCFALFDINRASASVKQERRDLHIPVAAREEKRGVAITILLINRIAASVKQERRDLHMPEAAREIKRGVAITILLINRIAASVKQERRDLHIPEAARAAKRGVATTILLINRIAASVKQERRDRQTLVAACEEKRGVAITILLINRIAASVKQERRDLHIPVAAREEKRGVAITILLINRIAASVEQERRDLHMPVAAREEKRGVAITILLINRIAASVKQERRDLQMPVQARVMKRCVVINIDAVKRHPSIKVQRARCHGTLFCRGKQPSLADLTASLTQCKNAEATGVRHHVQAHGVLQRNDPLVVVESTSADRHVEPFGAQLRQSLDDGFLQRPKGPARFPNLDVHILLPCHTRRDVHVMCSSPVCSGSFMCVCVRAKEGDLPAVVHSSITVLTPSSLHPRHAVIGDPSTRHWRALVIQCVEINILGGCMLSISENKRGEGREGPVSTSRAPQYYGSPILDRV